MAEPARKPSFAPRNLAEDDEPGILLVRWVERPDGRMEQVELPLTPELFLNPQLGDKWMQGERHLRTTYDLFGVLDSHFAADPDVAVTSDLQHDFGRRLPAPCPDVSVIRGVRKEANRYSFNTRKEGVVPCLILEVVSPRASAIRNTDLEAKVALYERTGIREYVIVDSTLQDPRFRLLGYRLDRSGRYRPIELNTEGRLFSETTSLWFQVSPDGNRVFVFESPSGRRLLNLDEERERADQEAQARKVAEAEVARLQTELDRLRRGE